MGFCRVSEFKPDKYNLYQAALNGSTACPDGNGDCLALQRASKFWCTKPGMEYRCPVAQGKFKCVDSPSACPGGPVSQFNQCRVTQATQKSTFKFDAKAHFQYGTRYSLKFQTALKRTQIPRQFEQLSGKQLMNSKLFCYDEACKYGKCNEGCRPNGIKYGHRTPAAKHLGDDLCMLTGTLAEISVQAPMLQLPQWCRPTCCQISLLSRLGPTTDARHSKNMKIIPASHTVVKTCGDGLMSVMDDKASNQPQAVLDGQIYSRAPATNALQLALSMWKNVGTMFGDAAVSQAEIIQAHGFRQKQPAKVCLLSGFVKTDPLADPLRGPKTIDVGIVAQCGSDKICRSASDAAQNEYAADACKEFEDVTVAAAVAVKAGSGDGKFGVWQLHPPPRLHVTRYGKVQLLLSNGTTFAGGSELYLSLSGMRTKYIKTNYVKTHVMEQLLAKPGHTPAECYLKQKNDPATYRGECKPDFNAEFNQCIAAAVQEGAKVQFVGSQWPAALCMLKGTAVFRPQEGEKGLVSVLQSKEHARTTLQCFPMMAVTLFGYHKKTSRYYPVVLEPQGVLRVDSSESKPLALQLDGNWYDPDVLSHTFKMGSLSHQNSVMAALFDKWNKPKYGTAVFPPTTNANGPKPPRKGLVKNIYAFTSDGKCGCWLTKRLVCELQSTEGYQCAQNKILLRAFKNFKRAKYEQIQPPQYDDIDDICKPACADRLLAL